MKIKSVELRNYRSYKNQKIELSASINIITGANNSGKSSLIKAIYKLQNNQIWGIDDIRKGQERALINIDITDINSFESNYFGKFQPDASVLFLQNNDKESSSGAYITKQSFAKEANIQSNYDINSYLNNSSIVYSQFQTLTNKINQQNFIFPFLAKRKTDYFDDNSSFERSYEVNDNLRNIALFIQRIGNSSHPLHKQFNDYCSDILGFTIGTIPSKESNGISVGIYANNNEIINIRSMGDGVINIIGLLAFLLSEDRKLYLIEELENDIHPEALKKLLNLIIEKSANNQFIISTHSNIVLKYLGSHPESRLFYVDWSPEDKEAEQSQRLVPHSTISLVGNTKSEKLKILQKLGYDLFDFELYDAYLILEESSAETIIRYFLIPQFFPKLANRLKTIAAGGTGELAPRFIDFLRLFVFIHTSSIYENRAWVIADGDQSGYDAISNIKATFESWPEKHFRNFSQHNFEEYYPERFKSNLPEILNLKGKDKRDAKKKLLLEVVDWINEDKEAATIEFQKSAKEVIDMLQELSGHLN